MNKDLKDVLKGIFWAIIVCTIISLCTGCKTHYVPMPTTQKEFVYHEKINEVHDSVYLHDSVYCAFLGDTMYIERWNTKYIQKLQYINTTDTICKVDSVAVPYEVVKYHTPRFNWVVMGIELLLLILLAVFVYYKKK